MVSVAYFNMNKNCSNKLHFMDVSSVLSSLGIISCFQLSFFVGWHDIQGRRGWRSPQDLGLSLQIYYVSGRYECTNNRYIVGAELTVLKVKTKIESNSPLSHCEHCVCSVECTAKQFLCQIVLSHYEPIQLLAMAVIT